MRLDVKVCALCQQVFDVTREGECDCDGQLVLRKLEVALPTHQEQIRTMLEALDVPLLNEDRPRADNLRFDLLRDLVAEEAHEFQHAMDMLELAATTNRGSDLFFLYWVDVIDAICDIEFVIHNTSNAMGIDIEPFFQEVLRANMAKVGGPTRPDGKKLKPEGWEPPRIKEMLEEVLGGNVG